MRLALALMLLAACAASRGVIRVSEGMDRALWKTKHCGVGVSFEACERAWMERR